MGNQVWLVPCVIFIHYGCICFQHLRRLPSELIILLVIIVYLPRSLALSIKWFLITSLTGFLDDESALAWPMLVAILAKQQLRLAERPPIRICGRDLIALY